jgi:hypothetical protein
MRSSLAKMVEWVYERAIVENVIPLYPSYWPTQFNDLPQKNTCNCWVYGDYLVGGAITIFKNDGVRQWEE